MKSYLKPKMDIKKYQLDIFSICGPSGGGGEGPGPIIPPEESTGPVTGTPTEPGNN